MCARLEVEYLDSLTVTRQICFRYQLKITQIRLQQVHVGRIAARVDEFEIDGDDFALGSHARGRNLRPTAGRCTRIKHSISSTNHATAIIDVNQLVGRA